MGTGTAHRTTTLGVNRPIRGLRHDKHIKDPPPCFCTTAQKVVLERTKRTIHYKDWAIWATVYAPSTIVKIQIMSKHYTSSVTENVTVDITVSCHKPGLVCFIELKPSIAIRRCQNSHWWAKDESVGGTSEFGLLLMDYLSLILLFYGHDCPVLNEPLGTSIRLPEKTNEVIL